MQYKDRRFAQDYKLRYFLFNTHLRHQLLSQATLYMKQGQWKNDDANLFKEAVQNNPKMLDGIMSFNKNIKSSSSYWKQKCCELLAMCKQLGKPNVFFTLSAADYHWPDLFKVIVPEKNFENLNETDRKNLMHKNPLITSYFFQYRMDQFVKLVLRPIFMVTDIWYRFEWRNRGSTHTHGVLWLTDAPNFNENNYTEDDLNELIKYFESFVFAITPEIEYSDIHPSQKKFSDIPDADQEEDLIHLIAHVQRHTTCGSHCLRRNIKTQKVACRYNFPCDLKEKAEINDDEGYLRFYPKRNESLIQRYSSIIMKGWRANHDFSPICSSTAVIYYIAKYISKKETISKTYETLLQSLNNIIDDPIQLKPLLGKLFIQSQGDRDISAQEVCHLLMGWPLVHCSRVFININLYSEQWNSFKIEGSNLKINKTSLIDQYRFRPRQCSGENIEIISLYEFSKKFFVIKNKYFKHKKERIVRIIPNINLNPESIENESYYRQQCLLHIPFRCEIKSILENLGNEDINTWKQLFFHYNLNTSDNVLYNEIPDDDSEELPIADDGIRQALHERNCGLGNFINDDTIGRRLKDISHNWKESGLYLPTINEVIKFLENYKLKPLNIPEQERLNLNFSADQKKVLRLVDQQINICLRNHNTKKPSFFRCIVQGKAGSGKSTLINEIVCKVKQKLGNDSIKVCAPTGAAALNINGNTIHSEFKLPMNAQNIDPLTGNKQKNLKTIQKI